MANDSFLGTFGILSPVSCLPERLFNMPRSIPRKIFAVEVKGSAGLLRPLADMSIQQRAGSGEHPIREASEDCLCNLHRPTVGLVSGVATSRISRVGQE